MMSIYLKLKLGCQSHTNKSEDQNDPNNYRPIPPLSVFNSTFKKLIYCRLMLFSRSTLGSVPFHSMVSGKNTRQNMYVLIDVVNQIQCNFKKVMFTSGIFID